MSYIKKIKLPSDATARDIWASKADYATTAGNVEVVFVVLDSLPTPSETVYNTYKGKIVLVPAASSQSGNIKDEYVILRSGSEGSYTYAWEKIGSTEVTIGKLVTTATESQTTSSGESFGSTITLHKISKTGDYGDLLNTPTIPSGTRTTDSKTTGISVSYLKPETATGSAGSATISGNSFTFTGTTATLTHSAHTHSFSGSASYTPEGTVEAEFFPSTTTFSEATIGFSGTAASHSHGISCSISGLATETASSGGHTHTVTGTVSYYKATGTQKYLTTSTVNTGYTPSGSVSVFSGMTVVDGVLSFTSDTCITGISSSGTTTAFSGVSTTSTSYPVITAISNTSTSASLVSGSAASAGAHTHGISNSATISGNTDEVTLTPSGIISLTEETTTVDVVTGATISADFTGAAATITISGNTGSKTVGSHTYQPAGELSGTATITGHTHSISTESTSATVTDTGHTHSITI